MARPATEPPEKQFYFIAHRSRAFPVLRLRTVARGERASRSIVNGTTGFWSIWIVESLILAGLGSEPLCVQTRGREDGELRGSYGSPQIAQWALMRVRWTLPLTKERKRT